MNVNIEKIKEVEKTLGVLESEREKLMDLRETFAILKFLLNDPELILDNIDVLYGIRTIINSSSSVITDMHDNIDITHLVVKVLEN